MLTIIFYIHKNICINIGKKVDELTQEKLREMYIERLQREKQCWISSVTGINKDVLSKFRHAKIDLYPYLFEKLEAYLLNK